MTKRLVNHHQHASGKWKTVCTSSALAWWGISPDMYNYSASGREVKNILGHNGWSVRSRMCQFLVKKNRTSLGTLRRQMRHNEEGQYNDYYYVETIMWKGGEWTGHCLVLNGAGESMVDTAPTGADQGLVRMVVEVTRKDASGLAKSPGFMKTWRKENEK